MDDDTRTIQRLLGRALSEKPTQATVDLAIKEKLAWLKQLPKPANQ